MRNAVSLGGDADTLAAIAGAVEEALHGLPEALVQTTRERYLQGAEDIWGGPRASNRPGLLDRFHAAANTRSRSSSRHLD